MNKKGIITATLIGGLVLGSGGLALAMPPVFGPGGQMHNTAIQRGYGYRWQINTKALSSVLSLSEQQTKELLAKLNNNPMMLLNAKAIANASGKSLNEVVEGLTKYNAYYYITQVLKLDQNKFISEKAKILNSLR